MSDHDQPTDQPDEVQAVTLADAARLLGTTTEAVRQRAKRGTLPSFKGPDGKIYIPLDAVQETSQPPVEEPHQVIRPIPVASAPEPAPVELVAARHQMELILNEWLQPLMTRMAEQAEEMGRLRGIAESRENEAARLQDALQQAEQRAARVEARQADYDRLRADFERLEAERDAARKEVEQIRNRTWWQRLFGG